MTFATITDLATAINSKIGGDFVSKFQQSRKELKGSDRIAGRTLFGNCHNEERWAINKGSGIEVQYHISYDDNKVYYGIGFNAQYVPFANEMLPQDYIKPYTQAFLDNQGSIKQMLPDYSYIRGSEAQMKNPGYGNFVLYGKTLSLIDRGDHYELSDNDLDALIGDLKKQYPAYQLIYKAKNQYTAQMINTSTYIELLKTKPQLILQGAPGTGKTYQAQEIAYQMIFDEPMSQDVAQRKQQLQQLTTSTQYAFVQFHPAYSYEDFIRGIAIKTAGEKISYQAEDRTFSKFAAEALQNFNDSKMSAKAYTREEWARQMVEEFRQDVSDKLANSGNIQITDAAYIDRLNSDTIRYRGDTWQLDGGVPNKDIAQ